MGFCFCESLLLCVDIHGVEVGIDDVTAKLLESKEELEEILLHQFMNESMEQRII